MQKMRSRCGGCDRPMLNTQCPMTNNFQQDETESWRIEMINLIADEVERLQRKSGCSLRFKDYLEYTYGTRDYGLLSNSQMKEFRKLLKSLTVEKLSREPNNQQIWLRPRPMPNAQ